MQSEEINVKMGIDGSSISSGLRSIKESISNWASQMGGAAGGEKTSFFGMGRGEVGRLVRELKTAFPEAGFAARLFLNPVVAAFTAAIYIVTTFKQAILELNTVLDSMEDRKSVV